jgi:hypothetical protein
VHHCNKKKDKGDGRLVSPFFGALQLIKIKGRRRQRCCCHLLWCAFVTKNKKEGNANYCRLLWCAATENKKKDDGMNGLNNLILNWCIGGCWFTPGLSGGVAN